MPWKRGCESHALLGQGAKDGWMPVQSFWSYMGVVGVGVGGLLVEAGARPRGFRWFDLGMPRSPVLISKPQQNSTKLNTTNSNNYWVVCN